MKISFSCIDCVSDPLEWLFKVEEAGFDGLEVIAEGSQSLGSEDEESEFKEKLREIHETTSLEISLHAPLSDINIASVNESIWRESVRQVKQSIALAHDFVSEICVVHPGSLSPLSAQMPEDAVLERQKAALREICKFASDFGLCVAVENMTPEEMLLCRKPEELVRLVEEVDAENIGICLDIGHAFATGTLQEFLKLIGGEEGERSGARIVHVHVSDNFGRNDEHLALGRGGVNWSDVLAALKNFAGIVVTEMQSFEDGVESLKFLRKFLR
ncbi:MAG: sugar phosphate isomerase/epimerase [Candidatus Methanospirare jalkutatii]|nr:MAG: sugar phosphate isomerase/epimerase [Candidatus Methanospirare jalkutatii]